MRKIDKRYEVLCRITSDPGDGKLTTYPCQYIVISPEKFVESGGTASSKDEIKKNNSGRYISLFFCLVIVAVAVMCMRMWGNIDIKTLKVSGVGAVIGALIVVFVRMCLGDRKESLSINFSPKFSFI